MLLGRLSLARPVFWRTSSCGRRGNSSARPVLLERLRTRLCSLVNLSKMVSSTTRNGLTGSRGSVNVYHQQLVVPSSRSKLFAYEAFIYRYLTLNWSFSGSCPFTSPRSNCSLKGELFYSVSGLELLQRSLKQRQ